VPRAVKHDKARAGGALIDRTDIVCQFTPCRS
jgi:hypothetical protein